MRAGLLGWDFDLEGSEMALESLQLVLFEVCVVCVALVDEAHGFFVLADDHLVAWEGPRLPSGKSRNASSGG